MLARILIKSILIMRCLAKNINVATYFTNVNQFGSKHLACKFLTSMSACTNNPGELNFSQSPSPFIHNISSKKTKEKTQMKKLPQSISKLNRIKKRFSRDEVCKGFAKIYLTGHRWKTFHSKIYTLSNEGKNK